MITKKNICILAFINFIFLVTSITSCGGGSDDGSGYEIPGESSSNSRFANTKWTCTSSDIDFFYDYFHTTDVIINLYFYSDTEGLLYYKTKDYYSDLGDSKSNVLAHFTYSVYGNDIDLEYYTDNDLMFDYFKINGSKIQSPDYGLTLSKEQMSSSDYSFISSLHGKTGDCRWYNDPYSRILCIVGKGRMNDYSSFSQTPWHEASKVPNTVIVDERITHIGNWAFANPSLGYVDMSAYSDLESIGDGAFSGASISTINLSNKLTSIGEYAFADCKYLTRVKVPKSIETIGDFAFYDCKSVDISNTPALKTIGNDVFGTCSVGWTNSEVIEEIGDAVFTNYSSSKLELPNSVKSLGHIAFKGSSLNEIHIGSHLENVVGTPFFPASKGSLYVNMNNPLPLSYDIVNSEVVRNWTLYVPEGCKYGYSQSPYWKNFGTIVETTSLSGDDSEIENTRPRTYPTSYSINGVTYQMIKVTGGPTYDFYMMQTELPPTSIIKINGIAFGPIDANLDNGVTKKEWREFIDNLREETGCDFQLPYKEEWTYAAKGGNKSKGYTYSGSNNIDSVAWYSSNSGSKIHDIAQKDPNELGLYDMSGNYAEVTFQSDIYGVDGPLCGGYYKSTASNCKPTSYINGKTSGDVVSNTKLKEYNAFDATINTVRLIYYK